MLLPSAHLEHLVGADGGGNIPTACSCSDFRPPASLRRSLGLFGKKADVHSHIPGILPGYDVTSWYGFIAPHGTPAAVIAKLNRSITDAIADPSVKERLTKAGVVVRGSSPGAFGSYIKVEFVRWNQVREAAGIAQE